MIERIIVSLVTIIVLRHGFDSPLWAAVATASVVGELYSIRVAIEAKK